jgi:hypothetical protein
MKYLFTEEWVFASFSFFSAKRRGISACTTKRIRTRIPNKTTTPNNNHIMGMDTGNIHLKGTMNKVNPFTMPNPFNIQVEMLVFKK